MLHGALRDRAVWRDVADRALAHPFTAILALFLLSRALLVVVGMLTLATFADGQAASVSSILCRFDCNWYVRVAEHGYSIAGHANQPGATTYAFFPLLPLIVRGMSGVTGLGVVEAGLLAANSFFLAALVYVHRYARQIGLSQRAGMLGVAILCFVPQSFVFSSVYTESLFLLLLAAAMLHLRRGQFLRAGLAAAALSATRANGIFFVVFAVAWLLRTHRANLLRRPWRKPELLLPVTLAPLGIFAFWAFSLVTTGDAFAHASTSSWGWGLRLAPPWENLIAFVGGNERSVFWALTSLAAFAASLLLLRQRRYEEFALCAAMFLLFWSATVPNSLLRYSIVLFPIWLGVAHALENRPAWLSVVLVVMLALGNIMLMVAWTLGDLIAI